MIGPKTIEATLQGVIEDEWRDSSYKLMSHRMEHMAKTRIALTKRITIRPGEDKTIATQFDIEDSMLLGTSEGELLYWLVERMHDLKVDLDLFDIEAERNKRPDVWDATIADRPVKARVRHAVPQEATETPSRPHKPTRKRSEHAPTVERSNVEVWAEGQAENLNVVIEANTSEAERLMKKMNRRIAQSAGTSPMLMPQAASWHALPVVPVRAQGDKYFIYDKEPWHVQPHPGTKLAEPKRSWWQRVFKR